MCGFTLESARCDVFFCGLFFFQAEDGIRDLVRSRGLGDVYKRQVFSRKTNSPHQTRMADSIPNLLGNNSLFRNRIMAVSYTHLTLPTSDLV